MQTVHTSALGLQPFIPNRAWDPETLCVVRLMALHREDICFNTCRFLKTLSEKRARIAEWLTLNGNFRQAFQSEKV